MEGLTEGRIVHFDRGEAARRCNAAIVTRVWGPGTVNLAFFTDGTGVENYVPVTATSVKESNDGEGATFHDPRACHRDRAAPAVPATEVTEG